MVRNYKLITVAVLVLVAMVLFSSCDDDEKPKTLPIVITSEITDVTTTAAKGGGEVANNGNAEIIARGLAYSSTTNPPTIADSKTEVAEAESVFESALEGLASSTTYYVRAYATNSVGTAYGEVVSFTTANKAPEATNISITGDVQANVQVTVAYSYSDAENDTESGTVFKWYLANDATGTGKSVIAGASSSTYKIQAADEGKFIGVGVTPMAASGTAAGTEVMSAFVGPIGKATTVTFIYNGAEVTYGIITSSVTGRQWLDRNLGAPNAATSFSDFANYGDMFQWGRLADGHQLINRGATNAETTAVNGPPSATLSSSDIPGHALFITSATPFDWRSPKNDNLWQGVSGINNPCPEGWRIPTTEEWTAENIANISAGYTQLKLTFGGTRSASTGAFASTTALAGYWTSSVSPSNNLRSTLMQWTATLALQPASNRGIAASCKCIKD